MMRTACAWYCAIILWMSGMQHVANRFFFLGTVRDYQLMPDVVAVVIAAVLPWLHIMLAAVLIAPWMRSRASWTATAILGCLFFTAQFAVVVRGIPVDCGCFGALTERRVGLVSMLLASSLVAASLVGAELEADSPPANGAGAGHVGASPQGQ